MRATAAVLYEVKKPLVIEEVELLDPGPHEVQVRWAANGVCHSDYHLMSGDVPHPLPVLLRRRGAQHDPGRQARRRGQDHRGGRDAAEAGVGRGVRRHPRRQRGHRGSRRARAGDQRQRRRGLRVRAGRHPGDDRAGGALHAPRRHRRRRRRVPGGHEGLARPGALPAAARAHGLVVRCRPPAHRRAHAHRHVHERQVQARGADLAPRAAGRRESRLRRAPQGRGQAQRGAVLVTRRGPRLERRAVRLETIWVGIGDQPSVRWSRSHLRCQRDVVVMTPPSRSSYYGVLMDDLSIRGGQLIDGTGAPGREADVSVSAGRIVAIEPRSARPAHRVVDARGHVVAPGFIDIHTHSDFTLPINPRAESKIRQGVTLEVVGNCGFSVAPALPGRAAMLREYLASSAPWLPFSETTFADYVAAFPPTAVNVILQVGHNTLRLMTAEMESRALTAAELATMERLLAEALAAGAWGLSSGLFTAPGCYADAAEIHALARVLRGHGAAYSSHIRDEANRVGEAVREAIAVAEATGVHVQIAHLKLSGVDNWGGADKLLAEIAAARRRGLAVDRDAYPYDTATNPLRHLFAGWLR